MLNEREVITVAFGNYSSLVAAQWANGTSHFDAHHPTLYTECRAANVLGGGGGSTGDENTGYENSSSIGNNQRTRVPRLLLLDAPYAATFDEVAAWEDKYKKGESNNKNNNNADEEQRSNTNATYDDGNGVDVFRGDARYVDTRSSASVLWGGSGSTSRAAQSAVGHQQGQKQDAAARRLDGVAAAVQRHLWAQHGLDDDGDGDDDMSSADGDASSTDDTEDAYARLRRELGIAPYGDRYDDEAAQQRKRRHASSQEEGEAEEDEEETARAQNNIPRHKQLTKKEKVKKLKKKLFDTHNSTIPWWQYITTGVAAHSVTSVKPLQHVDAAGDIPALHSFGYGAAQLRADKRAEMEEFSDALRGQLELADQLQGVQCFSDGDGMFGGAAHNVLEQFWEEAGPKAPVVHTCLFTPLPSWLTDRQQSSEVAFRERRLDETALNHLLATVHLSRHPSAVYIPVPLSQWGEFFKGTTAAATRVDRPAWLEDDRATAQYVAAVLDTALYGVRDGNNTHPSTPSHQGSSKKDDSVLRTRGPMYYMDDWCRVVRPAPSLRVAAAMGALPQPVAQSSELWKFLEANPLLPDAPIYDERMSEEERRARAMEAAVVDKTSPLRTGFVPLTHDMSAHAPLSSGGQVLGHAVSLRGAGVLPSTVYPAREAMLRYAMPLRTATYLPLLTESNYPISASFPMELLFHNPSAAASQPPRGVGALRDVVTSVDVGAHVLSTYASAPMLREVVAKAQAALRYKVDRYCAAYEMEKDEWREVLDEGVAVYDDYHHAAPSDADGSDDDGDY